MYGSHMAPFSFYFTFHTTYDTIPPQERRWNMEKVIDILAIFMTVVVVITIIYDYIKQKWRW